MSELETGSAAVAGNPAKSVNNVTPPDGGEPVVKVNAPGVNTEGAPDLSWMDALSDEEKAFAGNKAWKTPQHILESYRNLEKHLGAKGRAIPAEDDAEGWNKFYNELGRPEKAEDYKFDLPEEYNPEAVKFYQEAAHKAGMTKKQADAFLMDYMDFENRLREEHAKQLDIKVLAAQQELKQEWGVKYDENLNLALRGAKTLGLEQAEILALESAMGQTKFAKVFQQIGQALCAEDVTPTQTQSGSGGFGVRTPAQAQARIDELLSNPEYSKAYLNGDPHKMREMSALYEQVAAGRGQG